MQSSTPKTDQYGRQIKTLITGGDFQPPKPTEKHPSLLDKPLKPKHS